MLRETGFRTARVTSEGCNPFELYRAWRRGGVKAVAASAASSSAASSSAATGDPTVGAARYAGGGYQRVVTSYRLNEALMRNSATRALKAALNGVLSAARGGDSIKIKAIK